MPKKKTVAERWIEKYNQDQEAISRIDLTPEEEEAIERLNARIRINDKEWGDSLNDESAILTLVLASRRAARQR
jgi:hypothetical protein